jgi:2-polyprenyl-6-hydroxyphenyl methylase/3-demethylubiquinone-9 3-methyltransferase
MIDIEKFFRDYQEALTESEKLEILRLLSDYDQKSLSVEQIWQMMDNIWDELCCDNQKLERERIANFYNHPIWIVNGLFIEQDEISMHYRQVISDWISLNKNKISSIVDYGGGMGTLAQIIAEINQDIKINIYEPYPNKIAIKKLEKYPHIQFIERLEISSYDCLISTDVLEHVPDPLSTFAEMISSVKPGGYLIIANCFYSFIKCHLPITFHLRYTFNIFARMMGLKVIGRCQRTYAFIYRKEKDKVFYWSQIRKAEAISKLIFPLFQLFDTIYLSIYRVYRKIKKIIQKN